MNMKIEGCLWHHLPQKEEETQADYAQKTRFSRLMTRVSLPQPVLRSGYVGLRRRYRLSGGTVGELTCEIEEAQGKLHIQIEVQRADTYATLFRLSAWLHEHLRDAGYNVALEVKYVACDH
ncbi:Secretion system apparatus protein ssaP [unidentified bacterial endosymbiont]|uniref:Secretion system apparatus protein ssaP n=1 Tax=unidentified bacterial endosymbiont TaxID=2355 RepID=UPI0020A154ED|nr:Secretion system apparatus protein ssaP [unidentified bacterial endosymbiont]